MTNTQRLALVREFFSQWLQVNAAQDNASEPVHERENESDGQSDSDGEVLSLENSAGSCQSAEDVSASSLILSEAILIRDGFYCGRRFQAATHHGIWYMEEHELKIHDGRGQLLAVFAGEALADPTILVAVDDVTQRTEEGEVVSIPMGSADESLPTRQDVPSVAESERDSDNQDDVVKKAA